MTVFPERQKTVARNLAAAMLFEGDAAEKPIRVLSGGERHRVLLAKLLAQPANLLLLDEPTNHLDMDATDALLAALDQFEGGIVLVTHNEMFLRVLATRFVIFDGGRVRVFHGTYDDFLEKIGWEEEEEKENFSESIPKKNIRQKRASIVQEKSRVLKPLERQLAELEKTIEQAEEEKNHITTLLMEASVRSDGEVIREQSIALKLQEKRLQELYEAYYALASDVEEKQSFYDAQLKECEE